MELKACPLLEYLKQHRARCAKNSKMLGYWFCSEFEDKFATGPESELE